MVAGLLDTVLRELPPGALLVLEVGEDEPFVSRTMVGAPKRLEITVAVHYDGLMREYA